MPAANTDKLRKKKSLFQTTLNGGIGAGDTSLILQSASGLPTDTAITLVLNRVDANGVATPSSMEVITGTLSGSTVSNLVRAEDATTAKSHANASVVEMVWDAETWNDFVDAYLTEHNQDGTHKAAAVASTIVTAAAKTTPVNADSFGIVDSEASNVLKELTFTNLKAFLKTYFDTLYAALTGNNVFSGNNTFSGTSLMTGNVTGKFLLQEGALINGRILPADAAGLTLSLKTFAGTDPSATDPVYAVINGVVRSITAALSVSKADGTNWMNAGSAELATKEIDLFAYLGYNATDGVVIGFSRIPGARQYSDFSATTTNEKYCAISTITTAASTDYYTVIGRFAATLSAGAGYTWTVPTYTAINLIQRPIHETRWLDFATVFTTAGTAPTFTATNQNRYKIIGDQMYFNTALQNTSGGTAGSGANDLYQNLPFSGASSPSTNRGVIGVGASTGGANASRVVTYRAINTIAFQGTTLSNLLCSELATAARELYSDGKMQI